TPKTRAIVFASPSNPCGTAVTEEELLIIADLAHRHRLWGFYDEIYALYNYDRPHLHIFRYYPHTINLSGFSKTHSMTGWRVGTVVGPKEVANAMLRLQQYLFVCPPTPAQWGAIAAYNTSVANEVADYRRKRDYMVEKLSGAYDLVTPEGA